MTEIYKKKKKHKEKKWALVPLLPLSFISA